MAGASIAPGVPVTPTDPTATTAIDPAGRGPGDRRRQRAGRPAAAVRPEELDDDEDDRPPRPAPGRIDVIA